MKSNYQLHFRNEDAPFSLIELAFHSNGYGAFDYIVLFEKGVYSGYLSEKGLKEAGHFGSFLLENENSKNFFDNIEEYKEELKKQRPIKNVNSYTPKLLLSEYEKIEQLIKKFGSIYRNLEQPMLQSLERIASDAISDSRTLTELLSDQKMVSQSSLDKATKKVLDILIIAGHKKLEIHEYFEPTLLNMFTICGWIAQKYSLTKQQSLVLTNQEIKQAIMGEKPDAIILDQRLKGFAFGLIRDEWNICTGEEFQVIKNKIINKDKEIKGVAVYPGVAEGKVKVHLSTYKTTEIPKDAIFVTGMTNPQIIPLLKTVKAIVTDEGGLLCHAAIVAREFKIPCIVGTGNATQVLQNGDQVKVDANNGIVLRDQTNV